MVIVGEKSYKQIDEGPIRRVRVTRSPTSANAAESSGSEDEDGGMRVGADYQAIVPEFNSGFRPDLKHEAILVWCPSNDPLLDAKIDLYTEEAKERHGYSQEQALGLLFWHKHNIEKAKVDLSNFTPYPDEWSVEDKLIFEQAFGFHGKLFHRIRLMLPDKTIGSLVKFYYSWKKTQNRTSLIDRHANRMSKAYDISDEEMDQGVSSGSEEAAERQKDKQMNDEPKNGIGKAGFGSRKILHDVRMKNKRRPPRGIYLNKECLNNIVNASLDSETLLKQLNGNIDNLKRQIQFSKQELCTLKDKTSSRLSNLKLPENSAKLNSRWSNEELLLAVQGVRKYGKDFRAIAEVIGNKSETLVRSFFVNYRRRYNLDDVLAEYENEKQMLNGETISRHEERTKLMNIEASQANGIELTNGANIMNDDLSLDEQPLSLIVEKSRIINENRDSAMEVSGP